MRTVVYKEPYKVEGEEAGRSVQHPDGPLLDAASADAPAPRAALRFVERLDEMFAERYLEAVWTGSGRAWEPLLRERHDARVHPGAFMLAGVNAHVNYDLPIALVDTRALLGGELERDTPRHRDFERIDELLAETERELHDRLGTGRIEELVVLWGVVRARDHAWDAAKSLHALGGDRSRRCEFLGELAETVAGWGEELLRRGADAGR